MNIAEMHVWFRQYAQQMGMQNVRAILPEQIDVLINTAISDTVNDLVRNNVGVRNDRVITDNSKLNQINALRSLYKVNKTITLGTDEDTKLIPDANSIVGLHTIEKFAREDENPQEATVENPTYALDKVLYLVDLSIDYKLGATPASGQPDNRKVSQVFPIRVIEDAYLADTLNDFILKPRVRTPIAVYYQQKLEIYFGEDYKKANGLSGSDLITPNTLRVSYIGKPATVKYASDLGISNINCDLPESMHVDILKHAVDLYNTSINGGLYNNQQNQQAQQREIARNEARLANEGYQN